MHRSAAVIQCEHIAENGLRNWADSGAACGLRQAGRSGQVYRSGEKVAEHVAAEGGLDAIDAIRRVIKKVLAESPSPSAPAT